MGSDLPQKGREWERERGWMEGGTEGGSGGLAREEGGMERSGAVTDG